MLLGHYAQQKITTQDQQFQLNINNNQEPVITVEYTLKCFIVLGWFYSVRYNPIYAELRLNKLGKV